ncbi:MAG: phosphopantetheine-binding protein [Ruminococcus sp.]|nr:phosphopantetheine-binding protein [Ruminococcus sp.]MCM1381278.1 phosphopantetheine-binding protein [Muribaculaceae bacterium]MCM1478501.1 phosphopantetheine-binding protein [Muribaculaceae bacterium]
MKNLEKEIYEGLISISETDESEIEGFTYDSPIFNSPDNGDEVCMGLDSLDALELAVMIYDEWGIDVPAEDMGMLKTVNAIADYIRECREV